MSFRVTGSLIKTASNIFTAAISLTGKTTQNLTQKIGGEESVSAPVDAVSQYFRGMVNKIPEYTNPYLFFLLGAGFAMFILFWIFRRDKRKIMEIFPYIIFGIFVFGQIVVNAYGNSLLYQGWYRQFWQVPITLALICAVCFGNALGSIAGKKKLAFGMHVVVGILVIGGSWYGYMSTKSKVLDTIDLSSSPASAFPENLELVSDNAERNKLHKSFLPSWLTPNAKNYRVYESDAQVNVWWNSAYDIPLAKGYIDPPVGTSMMGNIFLVDQSLTGEGLVKNFQWEESDAKNMALFYLDWYGINTLEGGHLSQSANLAPSEYLQLPEIIEKKEQVDTWGVVRQYATADGRPEPIWDIKQNLFYYKFADSVTSPILSARNTPAVGFFTDAEGFEYFIRMLGAE
ncbi:MAG: hypothetical protein AAB874_00955, partial [Patescibacteria group bacterium]